MNSPRKNRKQNNRILFFAIGIVLVLLLKNILLQGIIIVSGRILEIRSSIIQDASLETLNSRISFLKREVVRLETEAKLAQKGILISRPESIPAFVLGAPPVLPFDTLLLKAGEKDGVRVGDVVVLDHTILGSVSEITGDFSRAILFSSPNKVLQASMGSAHAPIEVSGRGAGSFFARIPAGVPVAVHDIVSLEGAPDFIIGKVVSILPASTPSFQDVSIIAPVSFRDIGLVEILPSRTFPLSF